MSARTSGIAARVNGFFLTRKGEFMPLSDKTAIFETKAEAGKAVENRLGMLLPQTFEADLVAVKRVWVEA